jgi:23S rRNA pseudouridine2605 synthase
MTVRRTTAQGSNRAATPRRTGLARTLSKLGYCSRSAASALVRAGRVAVNGVVRRDPEYPVTSPDAITVDGQAMQVAEPIYQMMNKPRGLVTTASDEKGRPTVYSLLSPDLPWVSPVGRLDQASEGLLLFTNDPEWAARLTDPESHVPKTYHVQIGALVNDAMLSRLGQGIRDRGELLGVSRASLLRSGAKNSWIEVVLEEGRNRHLRRMFAALGVEVLRLLRVAIGSVRLGNLAKGTCRALSTTEKQALDNAMRSSVSSR